jgi:hypothetical protein
MNLEEDPDWRPVLRPLVRRMARVYLPWRWPALYRERLHPSQGSGLIAIRTIFVGLVMSPPLFVLAFSFITTWDAGDGGLAPYFVTAIGITCLVATAKVMPRPLATSSGEALAGTYRTRMFMAIGLAEGPPSWASCRRSSFDRACGSSLWESCSPSSHCSLRRRHGGASFATNNDSSSKAPR